MQIYNLVNPVKALMVILATELKKFLDRSENPIIIAQNVPQNAFENNATKMHEKKNLKNFLKLTKFGYKLPNVAYIGLALVKSSLFCLFAFLLQKCTSWCLILVPFV